DPPHRAVALDEFHGLARRLAARPGRIVLKFVAHFIRLGPVGPQGAAVKAAARPPGPRPAAGTRTMMNTPRRLAGRDVEEATSRCLVSLDSTRSMLRRLQRRRALPLVQTDCHQNRRLAWRSLRYSAALVRDPLGRQCPDYCCAASASAHAVVASKKMCRGCGLRSRVSKRPDALGRSVSGPVEKRFWPVLRSLAVRRSRQNQSTAG